MSREKVNDLGEGRIMSSPDEVNRAYYSGTLGLQAKIKVRLKPNKLDDEPSQIVETTTGRTLLYELLPQGMSFDLVNKTLDSKQISTLIDFVYRKAGLKSTVIFADRLMYMGYEFSTKSGSSEDTSAIRVSHSGFIISTNLRLNSNCLRYFSILKLDL